MLQGGFRQGKLAQVEFPMDGIDSKKCKDCSVLSGEAIMHPLNGLPARAKNCVLIKKAVYSSSVQALAGNTVSALRTQTAIDQITPKLLFPFSICYRMNKEHLPIPTTS